MSLTNLHPAAQTIINRLSSVDQTVPCTLDHLRIEVALNTHLTILSQSTRPIRWLTEAGEGFLGSAARDVAREVAWDVAWDAAKGVAWGAAWEVAWGAAWGTAWGAARDAARGAAWGAALDAAWGAARDAAKDVAWGVAISNTLYDHPKYSELMAVWMPFVDAFEAGLFFYEVTPKEILATSRPLLRVHGRSLHGDGIPAVEFSSGERYYFHQGVHIPDKWGSVSSEHWRPEWLLETSNVEHRRVLLQGLGYERIMASLPNTLLHRDGDMELREVPRIINQNEIDVEPIRLLKVLCSSTGRPYVLRVPPTFTTCDAARRWVMQLESTDQLVQET